MRQTKRSVHVYHVGFFRDGVAAYNVSAHVPGGIVSLLQAPARRTVPQRSYHQLSQNDLGHNLHYVAPTRCLATDETHLSALYTTILHN